MSSPWDYFGETGPEAAFTPPAVVSTPEPPKPAMGPRFAPDVDGVLSNAAKRHGIDEGLLRTFAKIESGGNPRNTTGSYKGLFQLSNQEFAKHGGSGNIYDPDANTNAAALKIKAHTADFSRKYGRDPTPADLYMIHQQGEGGYAAHTAAPDRPAWQSMYSTAEGRQKGPGWAKQAIWGNVPDDVKSKYGSVDNMTSRNFLDLWRDKVARIGGDGSQTASAPAKGTKMGDWVSPFQDNKMMGLASAPGIKENRAKYANADGTLGPQYEDGPITPALMAKHGLKGEDVENYMRVFNLQRDLMGNALKPPEMNGWDGLSMALKTIGAGLHARSGQGKAANETANSVGQEFREAADHSRKLNMQSAIQQAQLLGTNIDASLKAQMEQKRKREDLIATETAIQAAKTGGGSAATALPVPQAPQMPTVPPQGVASGVPGSVLAEPIPAAGGAPVSPQPAIAQGGAPSTAAVSPEEANLRAAGDVAWRAGNTERAKQLHAQADARRAELIEQAKPTGDIREFEYGVKNPEFVKRQLELKAAGRNMVTIDQRQETEEAKALGKGAGERANAMIARGQGAATTIQKLSTLEAIQDRVQTGRLAGAKLTAGQWAKELGVGEKQLEAFGIGKNFVGDAQTLQAQTSRMLVDMLGSGGFPSNNFSNADREFIEKTLPNLGNDPRGNRLMMAFMKRAAERDRDQYKAWAKAKEQPGMSFDKFALEWGQKVEAEDALGDLRKEAEKILGPSTPTARERKAAPQVPVSTLSTPKPVSASAMEQPRTAEDYAKLKPGTQFLAPDGTIREKPLQ